MRLSFIFNPNSGKSVLRTKLCSIIQIFTAAGYDVDVYPTEKQGDAAKKAYDICNSPIAYSLLACSGGDGTLNETIQGVMLSERKLPIGYIPTGTSNDFARSIGIPNKIEAAAKVIVDGKQKFNDIGQFNDIYFTYIAAFGAFSNVAYDTPQKYKKNFGYAAYLIEGLKGITTLKSYRMKIEYDDGTLDDEFAYGMITNTSSVGKFLTQKNIVLDDGVFEVTLIKMPNNIFELNTITSSLLDLNYEINNEQVICFRTKNIVINSFEPIKWTVDGEYGGCFKEVIINNKQKALEFIVGKDL